MSIAIEFNKFKGVLFGKKILRRKMKRAQSKKHKLGTHEINKIYLSCFDDNRYALDVRWLIFIKIVSKVLKRLKTILIIEKDCDNLKIL